ncbi:hypothetical protein SAMN05421505_12035 [Sinosporangium album]|uniref:Uncharacterized protein n=1 Tax=Sinosporangium album TaxID=504805 RepID=A0A1G8EC98_9ACTN|nr:hypothetical protein [Sinosporangium album]SDH67504.1 hypothetical protein SAMN05421505_12035 [Sinosporangium album]
MTLDELLKFPISEWPDLSRRVGQQEWDRLMSELATRLQDDLGTEVETRSPWDRDGPCIPEILEE